jgi:caffeoyl-CoA O-methyltransferase
MDPIVPPEIEAYAALRSTPAGADLQAVEDATFAEFPGTTMMVGALEGRFLAMLVRLTRARRVLEIGGFTGYSALWMASALPEDGELITLEARPRNAEMARRHVAASTYGERVDVRTGPALHTLESVEGPFDLVFIDADKENYVRYYEAVLPLLAPGGLIAVDNVLWSGRVLEGAASEDPDARAVDAFNRHVRHDPRVECVLLTVRDGITLIIRR